LCDCSHLARSACRFFGDPAVAVGFHSFQSHTVARKICMLTFLLLISTIHGCSSIRHGVARLFPSFSRLAIITKAVSLRLPFWKKCTKRGGSIPVINKKLEVVAPPNSLLWLVLQLWDWLAYDIRQQVNQACTRLYLACTISRKWESMLRNFEKCHTQGPDIRRDGVGLTSDSFGRHIV